MCLFEEFSTDKDIYWKKYLWNNTRDVWWYEINPAAKKKQVIVIFLSETVLELEIVLEPTTSLDSLLEIDKNNC